MLKKISIKIIKIYQKISKKNPNKCRMYPTCSNYAIKAITRFGFLKGIYISFKRIFRCANKKYYFIDDVPWNIKGEFKWLI